MLGKFVLGTLIALIGAIGGVLAVNAWERWRAGNDTAVRVVGVPATLPAPAAPRLLDPSTGDLDSPLTTTGPNTRVGTLSSGSGVTSLQRQQSATATPEAMASEVVPVLHPQVQAQGMEIVQSIINEHADSWTWLKPARDAAKFSFFEDLPESCASALGCYNHRTGEAWLSLDALRIEHEKWSPYEGPSSSDIVLHELAHAFIRSTEQGSQLLDQFAAHYAGCRSDRDGLDTDRLAGELLADTMAIAAQRATENPSRIRIFNGRPLSEIDYGYFRDGGFDGCLADSSSPDPVLVDAIYATTFDCESQHALDVFEAHYDSYALTRPSEDSRSILKTCFGVQCHAGDDCEGWSETDSRQAAASEAVRHRSCADGIVKMPGLGERVGWEASCGRSYVPADVECLVDLSGNEVDLDYTYAVFAAEFSDDGVCLGLWCRDQTETFAMLGGACRSRR